MDRTRKKLIEELIRVGRLIDPAPDARQRKSEDVAEFHGIVEQYDIDNQSLLPDLEDPPVVNDVVDQPYSTKDMFFDPVVSNESRSAKDVEEQYPVTNTSDSSDTPLREHVGSVATDSEKTLCQETTGSGFPIEELARELVTLIEDRVSQRSGVQLDDTFRDELTQAVITQLEDWLRYD